MSEKQNPKKPREKAITTDSHSWHTGCISPSRTSPMYTQVHNENSWLSFNKNRICSVFSFSHWTSYHVHPGWDSLSRKPQPLRAATGASGLLTWTTSPCKPQVSFPSRKLHVWVVLRRRSGFLSIRGSYLEKEKCSETPGWAASSPRRSGGRFSLLPSSTLHP